MTKRSDLAAARFNRIQVSIKGGKKLQDASKWADSCERRMNSVLQDYGMLNVLEHVAEDVLKNRFDKRDERLAADIRRAAKRWAETKA